MIKNGQPIPDIFHVGYQRTGSTWLQKGLFPRLSDKLYAPPTRQWNIYHANCPADVAGIYSDLPMDQCEGRIIIDSEEAHSGGRFRDYLEIPKKMAWINPDAKIIMCIRSQYEILPSLYYLYVRKGGALAYRDYINLLLENRKLDYWALYNAYCDVFGPGNVKVMLLEDLARDPAAYTRNLLNAISVEMDVEVPGERYRNSRASFPFLFVLRCLNRVTGLSGQSLAVTKGRTDEVRDLFTVRNRMSRPFQFFFEAAEKFGMKRKKPALDGKLAEQMNGLYGPGNKLLFEAIGRDIGEYRYPG